MAIIAWILALICLAIIVFISARKFPLLANIDVSQIAAEQQAEVKKRILSDKFKRNSARFFKTTLKFLAPLGRFLAKALSLLYHRLINLKESYGQAEIANEEDAARKIEALFAEAADLARQQELAKAESKYIEIIGLDSKNFKAFELLGENYLERENYQEAEQTFEHAIKLKEQLKRAGQEIPDIELAKSHFGLGLVYNYMNNQLLAAEKIKCALELEPNNPRYLDKLVEICIMLKDAALARQTCTKLEEVNPGNKKLRELKKKIRELENKLAIAAIAATAAEVAETALAAPVEVAVSENPDTAATQTEENNQEKNPTSDI